MSRQITSFEKLAARNYSITLTNRNSVIIEFSCDTAYEAAVLYDELKRSIEAGKTHLVLTPQNKKTRVGD